MSILSISDNIKAHCPMSPSDNIKIHCPYKMILRQIVHIRFCSYQNSGVMQGRFSFSFPSQCSTGGI